MSAARRAGWASVVAIALVASAALGPALAAGAAPISETLGAEAACGQPQTQPLPAPVWALARLRPELAWPLSRGRGVIVAVIDSGVSAAHPALAGQVLAGRDMTGGGDTGQCDEYGHGTLVAGIIAGREVTSGGYRFFGVAPEATILPVRVIAGEQRSSEPELPQRIADAVDWAVDEGADVINLSLTTAPTPALAAAIRRALDAGVVVVAAAGNDGATGRADGRAAAYPAAYDGVIGVAGSDQRDRRVDSSTPGDFVDVAAPGIAISGPAPAGGGYTYVESGGTSFAAAYVSGVAALVRARDPSLSPAEVAARIAETADHPLDSWNPEVGRGVVNPARAVGALAVGATPIAAASPGRLVVAGSEPSPREGIGAAAPWVVAAGLLTTLAVLVAVPVTRRGRARRWHPDQL